MNPTKLRIAQLLSSTGLSRSLLAAQRVLFSPYVRALNYHDVPPHEAEAFEAQVEYFLAHFEPIGLMQLKAFLDGQWRPDRPGLILSFDDGLRSHAEVVAPILERHGVPGWFCVPAGLPDCVGDDVESLRGRQLTFDRVCLRRSTWCAQLG